MSFDIEKARTLVQKLVKIAQFNSFKIPLTDFFRQGISSKNVKTFTKLHINNKY